MHRDENHNDNYFEEKMKELFEKNKSHLNKQDIDQITEFIVHGECGVAYDGLCYLLYGFNIPISQESYNIIVEIGQFMGYPESRWTQFESLISDKKNQNERKNDNLIQEIKND